MYNKTKKNFAVTLICIAALTLTACSSQTSGLSADTSSGAGAGQTSESEEASQPETQKPTTNDGENEGNGNDTPTNTADASANDSGSTSKDYDSYQTSGEIWDNDDLEGDIYELGNGEFLIHPIVSDTEEYEGQTLDTACSEGDETVHVSYDDNTEVKVMKMSLSAQKMISMDKSDTSAITNEVMVSLFGTSVDSEHFNADMIVVVLWE